MTRIDPTLDTFLVDSTATTPSADAWGRMEGRAAPLDVHGIRGPVLALVPHADDETLGFGGLLLTLSTLGVPVDFLLVTDGSQSHPGCTRFDAEARRTVRENEFRDAVVELGGELSRVRFWRKPDTRLPYPQTSAGREAVAELREMLEEGQYATVLTPWRHDPHGDHEATTALLHAALTADAKAPRVLEYCVWLGHQGSALAFPEAEDLAIHRFAVDQDTQLRKHAALLAHQSQFGKVFDDPTGFTIPQPLADSVFSGAEYFIEQR